jgi:DNA-binding CsgD family transcriptional regulator
MPKRIAEKTISEMVKLKRAGLTNKEIAKRLSISQPTVGQYLKREMRDYEKYKNLSKKIAEKTISEMVKLKRAGLTNKEIAKKLSVSRITVGRYLRKEMNFYEKYREKGKGKKVTDTAIKKMIEMRREGKTLKEIAKKLSLSHTTVMNYLRKEMSDYIFYCQSKGPSTPPKPFSRQKITHILQLKKTRKSCQEIAKKLHISPASVSRKLRQYMEDYDKYRLYSKISNKEIERMIEMRREGKTLKEIGDILGISHQTVMNYLRKEMDDYKGR